MHWEDHLLSCKSAYQCELCTFRYSVLFCSLTWKMLKVHFFISFKAVFVITWYRDSLGQNPVLDVDARQVVEPYRRPTELEPTGVDPMTLIFSSTQLTGPHWNLRTLSLKFISWSKRYQREGMMREVFMRLIKVTREGLRHLFQRQVPLPVPKILYKWNEEQVLAQSMSLAWAGAALPYQAGQVQMDRGQGDTAWLFLGIMLAQSWKLLEECIRCLKIVQLKSLAMTHTY